MHGSLVVANGPHGRYDGGERVVMAGAVQRTCWSLRPPGRSTTAETSPEDMGHAAATPCDLLWVAGTGRGREALLAR